MTQADSGAGQSLLTDRSSHPAADIVLGIIVSVAAVITIWDARELPLAHWYELNSKFYPSMIAGLLVLTAVLLIARGVLFPRPLSPTWTIRGISLIALAASAIMLLTWQLGWALLLKFGPPEFAALSICILALAIALSRRSRLRAAGMTLLGLLLATVGIDASTGQLRMTLDLEILLDGFDLLIVAVGVIGVADSLVCLRSPQRYLEGYGWLVARWRDARTGTITRSVMRLVAVITLLAAGYFAYTVNNSEWDVLIAALFGVFGVACKIYGWNRIVLLVGFAYSPLLEQSLRQSMLLSNGNPEIFFRLPIGASVWLFGGAALILAAILSVRRTLASRAQ
jgi:TctA family transporter